MFSLRIVNVDHYMSAPKPGLDLTYSQFRGTQIKSVPVFRIFGSTPSGNKTCLHVHGVFPYILVPYSGEDEAGRLMYQLASSLDKAINVSQNTSYSSRQHVFKIAQVSGRPFYGYHSQDHQFLKIFFYNPSIVKRACDLLQNGAVCGTKFQIHEGHVPFTLQFFIDYNLYGMSFINLKGVVYRRDACPPGFVAGELVKDSFCELEADAVAVDILNRLTIEGELAVNPGLAAIWEEEKKRLKRNALEVSQRSHPAPTVSEVLLREKLSGNLKFQGKCKTPLKENIPYPAETQRTSGSGVLDASVLDTHSLSSLAVARSNVNEETIIDEELALSLTQSSILSSSLDQSLFEALVNLAAQNEFVNAVITQQVEDDSILGSQIVQDQDMFGNDTSDGELEALNYSFPPDLLSDDHPECENEETDENYEESIPQLDGVGDVGGKKKKSKQCKKKKVSRGRSPTVEAYLPPLVELLLNTAEENNSWPESEKQETLEEIFSEEEPYNSPIDNFEDRCESVDIEPINVNMINSFETVLRGDPSFTSEELASEDAMFQPIEDCAELDEKKPSTNDESINQCISGKKLIVDKNSNFDTVPLSNMSLDAMEMEKSLMLVVSGEEFLNTSQLDQILDEDLNQGLKIICEKSPKQEFEDNWLRSGEVPKEDIGFEVNLSDDSLKNNAELLYCNNDNNMDERTDSGNDVILDNDFYFEKMDLDEIQTSDELNEDGFVLGDLTDNSYEKISAMTTAGKDKISQPQETDPLIKKITPKKFQVKSNNILSNEGIKNEISPRKSPLKSNNYPSNGNITNNISHKSSFLRGSTNKFIVNLFKNKKKIEPYKDLSEMTRKEIETYYLQLKTLTEFLSQRSDIEKPQHMLWRPIRQNKSNDNLGQKKKRKRKCKITSSEEILKKCKFSHEQILKMKNCEVIIHKLTLSEISCLKGKPMDRLSPSNENQTEICVSKCNKSNLKIKSLNNKSKHHQSAIFTKMNFGEETCINVKKKERSYKLVKNSKKVTHSVKTFPKRLSVKEPVSRIGKKPKQRHTSEKKSLFFKESQKRLINNVPVTQDIEMKSVSASDSMSISQVTNFKKKKMSKEFNVEKMNKNKSLSKTKQSLLVGDSKRTKQKQKNTKRKCVNSVEETKNTSSDSILNKSLSSSNKDTTSGKDQSRSFKFNTNCVIKMLPLPSDVTSELSTEGDLRLTEKLSELVVSKVLVPQECKKKKKEIFVQKPFGQGNNETSSEKVEKLVTSSFPGTFEEGTKRFVGSKKTNSCVQDYYNSSSNTPVDTSNTRKQLLRIYCLDGTADNSSSDESVSNEGKIDGPQENTPHYSTPNKRRKSKSSKNYVPLSIEIKKSPKIKLNPEKKNLVVSVERLCDESSNQSAAKDGTASKTTEDESKSACCSKGNKIEEPVVIVSRLPSVTKSSSDTNISTNKREATPSTSRPQVKQLKVLVKRLSLDTPGQSLEHKRVLKLRRRVHRSASVPVTVV